MRACGPVRSVAASYFTYSLGKDLHVPLTSRCNSQTLPQLRGDGFTLPVHVVAALCRVRDVERAATASAAAPSPPRWAGWCAYLDTQEGNQKLPPPDPAVAVLPPLSFEGAERAPKTDDLFYEIQQQVHQQSSNLKSKNNVEIQSIVLSGEGEPTLRWDDMIVLAKRVHEMVATTTTTHPDLSIRLITNGLLGDVQTPRGDGSGKVVIDLPSMVQSIVDSGISRVSVGLITADPQQYKEIVQPVMAGDDESVGRTFDNAHDIVCRFIEEAVRVEGLEVETTAVARDDVDKARTEELSQSLGVVTPVRWRPYFP
jgi:hypothetical protein